MNEEGSTMVDEDSHSNPRAHESSTRALPDGIFPVRLSAVIDRSGLTLERIAARLQERKISCSPSTLSLWRNGRTRPVRSTALEAVEALEAILDTPRGYLTEAQHRSPERGASWWNAGPSKLDNVAHGDELRVARADFGMDEAEDLRYLAVLERYVYDSTHRLVRSSTIYVLQAGRFAVERISVSTFTEREPELQVPPLFRMIYPRSGARLGRVREFPKTGGTVAELLLDRLLLPGEITTVEFETRPSGAPQPATSGWNRQRISTGRTIGRFSLSIEFSPQVLPQLVRLRSFEGVGERPEETKSYELIEVRGNEAFGTVNDLRGGGVELGWLWSEEDVAATRLTDPELDAALRGEAA